MQLVEGVDYYREGEWVIFTAAYLLRRGYCCESGCRHCPYGFSRPAEVAPAPATKKDPSTASDRTPPDG